MIPVTWQPVEAVIAQEVRRIHPDAKSIAWEHGRTCVAFAVDGVSVRLWRTSGTSWRPEVAEVSGHPDTFATALWVARDLLMERE